MPPALVRDVNDQMRILQRDVFGPLLPVTVYDTLDDVIAYVNRHERPLALYGYGRDLATCKRVLGETISGGVPVND